MSGVRAGCMRFVGVWASVDVWVMSWWVGFFMVGCGIVFFFFFFKQKTAYEISA